MSTQITRLAAVCTVTLAGLSGCVSSARYVTVNPDDSGGIIAIPSNTNEWPNYYRKEAEELIQAKCPNGYKIEREGVYVLGTNYQVTAKPGEQTSTRPENTEYRIYYLRKDAPPGTTLPPELRPEVQPAAQQSGPRLTPTGTPVPQLPNAGMTMPGVVPGRQSGLPPGY